MSRYTGSTNRKARRLGISILETGKEFSKGKKRTTAPGQHGAKKVKLSNYGQQQKEKQKLQLIYGLTDRKMRNTFKVAKKMGGVLGENLLQTLESRMDNLVYRAGFCSTRRQARQLVNHGHVLIDGRKMDICSHLVKVGSTISIKEKARANTMITNSLKNSTPAAWIQLDSNNFSFVYSRLPERKEMNQEVNETFVVEWYKRMV